MPMPSRRLTATLLRRVAHAVDGLRTGEEVFVVVDTVEPYRVILVTPDHAEAEKCAAGSSSLIVAGPYQTAMEAGPKFLIDCHEPDSDWCPWLFVTAGTFNPPRWDAEEGRHTLPKGTDVERITVEWTLRDGATGSKTFRWGRLAPDFGNGDVVPHMVDALFFTQAAVDKFMVPYINRVQTSRTAFEFSQRMRDGVSAVATAEAAGNVVTDGDRMVPLMELHKVAEMV